jgi:hypothetical protein
MHLSSVAGMGQTTQVPNRDGLVEVTVDPAGVVTPCIITPSAYGGVHEGGKWMAFPMEHVPRAAIDSETVVVAWFAKNDWRVGVGDTPNDALANLLLTMQKAVKDGRAAIHYSEA